jgi:hypothetical protein
MTGFLRGLAALALVLLTAAGGWGQNVPPDDDWRTFDTEHFRVTYTPELEALARRAAARAEEGHALLSRELVRAPRGRIDLLVSNHVDFANGLASPFPRNQIVIYGHPPANTTSLEFTNDWLEMLVLHELVHVFHMDHATGPLRDLRSVLGRNPVLFPQIWTTGWMIEGLAVYFESRLTGGGRVLGTHHDMVLRTAILEDRFFSIDRASVDPVRWPGGSTRYIYGSMFVEHLANRFGPERIPEFVERSGGALLPFRLNAAARRTFDVSFDAAWRGWEDSLRAHYGAVADSIRARGVTEPEILVAGAREARFPRYSPGGDAIAYLSATGVDPPATMLLTGDGESRVVAHRFGGGPISWRADGGGFLDTQLEYADRRRIFTDLLMVQLDGSRRWLTRGARVWSADLHPGGDRAVAVADADGTNRLVVVDPATGAVRELIPPDLDVHWANPRWSPDGGSIAVTRMMPGARHDVVIVDPGSGAVTREVTADRALDSSPAWSPDGRYLVFSSDRTGIANLHAYEVETGRLLQVTNVLTGAFDPDVSPDGRWIAFSLYASDGYRIARVPFEPERWTDSPDGRPEIEESPRPPRDPARAIAAEDSPGRRYSPMPTVTPATWVPMLEDREVLGISIGAASWGGDVAGRHEWSGDLAVMPRGGRIEGAAEYWYAGFGEPSVGVDALQEWRLQWRQGTELAEGLVLPQAVLRRDRAVGASVRWVRPRFRRTVWGGVRGEIRERERSWLEPESAPENLVFAEIPREAGAALNLGTSTVRGFALSTGPQQGVSLSATLSGHRFLESADEPGAGGYGRLVARSRGYRGAVRRAGSRDVIALRLDGGIEQGRFSPLFDLGGTGGGSPGALVGRLETHGYAFPVRGYAAGAQWGDRVAIASAEYRIPIAAVDRGAGLLPLNLGRLSATTFVDAGTAWCSAQCGERFPGAPGAPDPLVAVGVEANAEVTFGFRFLVPLRVGVAVPLVGERRGVGYLRTGRAF